MGVNTVAGVLAVDAGNSKTDVAIIAPDGQVLGAARGPSFVPHRVGARAAVAGLGVVVEKAAVSAGLGPDSLVGLAQHTSACLANADLPREQHQLEEAIAEQGWGASSTVCNDTFALLRAGLDEPRGVAVVCGAGINCAGLLPDGRQARFAAVGQISGDWGGGGFLWQEAMWWAARDADGRGPSTSLRTALPAHFGLPTMAALIEAIHLGEISESRCLELTPLLFEAAAGGDDVATGLVRRQAREVVALAVAAIVQLDVLDEPIDVLLGGGVLTAGYPSLLDEIHALLAAQAPRARARVVTIPPVVGAGLLGLDHIGAPDEAKSRLRSSTPLNL